MNNESRQSSSFIERCAIAADQSRHALLHFGLLCALLLVMLFPLGLTGNEENIFQLAFRRVSPEEFSPFHAAFDQSNVRFAFEYLLGSFVYLFGYDGAHAIARVAMAVFYAAGLTCFFRSLGLSALDSLLTLLIFEWAGAQLLGGEWLFSGVESKTLAYAWLFFAFGWANRGRWRATIIACAAATYMHFLVGGFWTLVILLLHWRQSRDARASGKALLLYCVLTLPLLAVLADDQLGAHAPPLAGISTDMIYAEIRNLHHVAPFLGPDPFWTFWVWLPGLVATACLAVVMWTLTRRDKDNLVAMAGLIGLVELLLAMLVSYADRKTLVVAKFYLFRPSSLTLFLVISALVGRFKESLSVSGQQLKALLVCALVLPFSWWHIKGSVDDYRDRRLPESEELVAAVEAHAKPDDIVLIEPYGEFRRKYLRLHRDIHRPTLVSWKFVPTNPAEILRWYSLIEMRKSIFNSGCGKPMDVPVRWLVALRPESVDKLATCGPVVWQKGNLALIQVDGRSR